MAFRLRVINPINVAPLFFNCPSTVYVFINNKRARYFYNGFQGSKTSGLNLFIKQKYNEFTFVCIAYTADGLSNIFSLKLR